MKMILAVASLSLLLAGTAPADEFGPWSEPVNLGAAINSASDDMHPTLSKDGLSLFFSSTRPGGAGRLDLYVAQRDTLESPWQPPVNLSQLNTPFDDHAANLTMDGHWLFFYSTRPGGCNAGQRTELWASHRKHKRDDMGWEPPINLGCTLNTAGVDQGAPGYWHDDETDTHYLYFARNETPADPNGFRIHVSTCTADLDECNVQQLWSPAVEVTELNSAGFRNTKTGIRLRDGLEIFVTSNRPGTAGGLDLWVAERASVQEAWSSPVDLDQDNRDKCLRLGMDPCPVVNSTVNDGAAALSWDGRTMFLYSSRAGGLGGVDLYVTTRAKVKRER